MKSKQVETEDEGTQRRRWVRKEYTRTMAVLIDRIYRYMVALDAHRSKFKAISDICQVPVFPPLVFDPPAILKEMEGIYKQFYTGEEKEKQSTEAEAAAIVAHLATIEECLNVAQSLSP